MQTQTSPKHRLQRNLIWTIRYNALSRSWSVRSAFSNHSTRMHVQLWNVHVHCAWECDRIQNSEITILMNSYLYERLFLKSTHQPRGCAACHWYVYENRYNTAVVGFPEVTVQQTKLTANHQRTTCWIVWWELWHFAFTLCVVLGVAVGFQTWSGASNASRRADFLEKAFDQRAWRWRRHYAWSRILTKNGSVLRSPANSDVVPNRRLRSLACLANAPQQFVVEARILKKWHCIAFVL